MTPAPPRPLRPPGITADLSWIRRISPDAEEDVVQDAWLAYLSEKASSSTEAEARTAARKAVRRCTSTERRYRARVVLV